MKAAVEIHANDNICRAFIAGGKSQVAQLECGSRLRAAQRWREGTAHISGTVWAAQRLFAASSAGDSSRLVVGEAAIGIEIGSAGSAGHVNFFDGVVRGNDPAPIERDWPMRGTRRPKAARARDIRAKAADRWRGRADRARAQIMPRAAERKHGRARSRPLFARAHFFADQPEQLRNQKSGDQKQQEPTDRSLAAKVPVQTSACEKAKELHAFAAGEIEQDRGRPGPRRKPRERTQK